MGFQKCTLVLYISCNRFVLNHERLPRADGNQLVQSRSSLILEHAVSDLDREVSKGKEILSKEVLAGKIQKEKKKSYYKLSE